MAAISRDNLGALEEAHEWPGTNLAGTRFVFLTQRASTARCTVYAFEEASVALADEDGASASTTISAFSATTFGPFNALDDLLTITSDVPVLVSCWNANTNDFVVLEPVSSKSRVWVLVESIPRHASGLQHVGQHVKHDDSPNVCEL